MYVLFNQSKEAVAYIETNMIVDANSPELVGVLLGNCLFDRQGKLTGKFFGGVVYNLKGEQLAEAHVPDAIPGGEFSFQKYLQEASSIVYSITNHADVWIEPAGKWGKASLMEELNAVMVLA
jgi:hypothetical protein